MAHQRPWNKYEVALLIECYINVTEKGRPLEDELIRLSTVLRQMAINTGLEIDEVYRNLNGMHWQYGFMKATFEGAKNSGNPSKLFFDMVALYRTTRWSFMNCWKKHIACQGERKQKRCLQKKRNSIFSPGCVQLAYNKCYPNLGWIVYVMFLNMH